MVHTFIGDLGHVFVIVAFVSAVIAAISYFKATSLDNVLSASAEMLAWKRYARVAFFIHALSVIGVVFSLFFIIYNNYYEYHYAWSHSSRNLPAHYMISCFWEGQEGSFLVWIFWQVLLGGLLIKVNKTWEAPVLTIFCLVQAFLLSMILGVVIPGIDLKLGSSPFILLKDYMGDIPVYKTNPDFIPEDGTGLNPLLQNYWMVIHPPTLFLGFAATLVPFAYCIAGLWKKQYKEWIRPALPWALFAALALGAGILMGGYWAYETLNFGGYWNWDPVENAVYVPWLILIGSIHTMISYRNSNTALRASIILVITTFILILYSTFLTRSGILGNASVHSFTDLGLSGQLLIYLLAFLFLALILLIFRWKDLPSEEGEVSVYSREFWIFIGVTVLGLAAFQVLAATSIPVYNKVFELFGIESQMAPPADQEEYYSKFQIWAGILIAVLSGIGQFYWWKKADKNKLWNALSIPLFITFGLSTLIILFGDLNKPTYILLVTTSIFSIVANGSIFLQVVKNNYRLSGGAVAHIGIAMMLIGILYSSGYSKIISLNNSGLIYSKEFSEEMNRDNILLWRNDPQKMRQFELVYEGQRFEGPDFPGYINKDYLFPTDDKTLYIAKRDIEYNGEVYYKKGDTVQVFPENTYYEVLFKDEDGDEFTLYPRAQVNPQMGLLASPDIKRFFDRDLYSHVSSIPVPDQEREWSETEIHKIKVGDTIIVNDYFAIFKKVSPIKYIPGVKLGDNDVAIVAQFLFLGKDEIHEAYPTYIVRLEEKITGFYPEIVEDLGVKIALQGVHPETDEFTFAVNTTQKDYIILKAMEKPLINVLWIGTLLLVIGLFLAILRRYNEFKKMRDKGMEMSVENKQKYVTN
ncbi:MAG TPA: cytochrome c biogenesis protein CcsA [Cytophagaceae bacterium]